jgi:hypothetical protein
MYILDAVSPPRVALLSTFPLSNKQNTSPRKINIVNKKDSFIKTQAL